MRKLLKIFKSRLVIFGIALLVQLGWMTILLYRLSGYSKVASISFTILSIVVALFIINKDDNPAYKMAWLIPILLIPLFGGLLYVAVGNKKPSRKLRNKLQRTQSRLESEVIQETQILENIKKEDKQIYGQMRYIWECAKYPVYKNTNAKYYTVGEDFFESLLKDLKSAKHFIFMEYFIIEEGVMWERILEVLEEKAKQGVDVRLIYDDMGCVSLLPFNYDAILEKKGIHCHAFNRFIPFWSLVVNHRDHRKLTLIDGHTCYSGGLNLADEYINIKERFGHWKDTGFCIYGEAVWNYTTMFLEMWESFHPWNGIDHEKLKPRALEDKAFQSDGYIQPYGDTPLDNETVGRNIYLNMINQATDYLYVFTPYLLIDNDVQTAFCLASKRGVDVRIVMPGIPDKKLVYRLGQSNYPPLLKAGVRIFEYAPGFLHAKSYVSDDKVAAVGTINMDYRSLYLHFESGTYFYQSSIVQDIKKDCLETMEKSREVSLGDTNQRFWGRLTCAVIQVFSPLL